jgi:soluble lytic murein transglycosylase-like protein
MQLVDATFLEIAKKNKKEWTLQNIYEPAVNIEAGTLYLKKMIKYFSAKVPADVAVHFALSAYNAGPVRVNYGLTQIGLNNEAIAWENLKKYLPKVTCHYVESIMLTA